MKDGWVTCPSRRRFYARALPLLARKTEPAARVGLRCLYGSSPTAFLVGPTTTHLNMTNSATSSLTALGPTAKTSLDEFIARLQVLQAQGAGDLPVLIETRNRRGAVIFASANARQDTVVRVDGGFRRDGTSVGQQTRVVRIG